MRIVALEEHFAFPDLVERIPIEAIDAWGWPRRMPAHMMRDEQLHDLGARRLRDMDEAGVTLQVLSAVGPGADLLSGEAAIRFAREANDRLAEAVARHPNRLAGFAHLPMGDGDAAAAELERAVKNLGFKGGMVHGTIAGDFLDAKRYEPLIEQFALLDVPLYLHPGPPPRAVFDAYYAGLREPVDFLLSTVGWGWHSETALHVLRLYLGGVLERHRGLRLIVGHAGEGLPAMLARCEKVFTPVTSHYLERSVSKTLLDQLWLTISGFFDRASFMAALTAFGADRIMFSVDYPYAPNTVARRFLDELPLSSADIAKVAHGNADAVLGLAGDAA